MIHLFLMMILGARGDAFSCVDMTEKFCQELYAPERMGNLQEIKLGRTQNDILYSHFFFLKAIEAAYKDFPKDMQKAFEENRLRRKIKSLTTRKSREQFRVSDNYKEAWSTNIDSVISQSLWQLANLRTEKVKKGYLSQNALETPSKSYLEQSKQLDQVYAEFYQTVWQKNPAWLEVQKTFELVRSEYIKWISEGEGPSKQLKKFQLEQLNSLKLEIPGSNPRVNFNPSSRCAIDQDNAYYNWSRHSVTACAGSFTTTNPLLTLAHEVGHSIGIARRVVQSLSESDFGKLLHKIWKNSENQTHLACEDWNQTKSKLRTSATDTKPYIYDDNEFLKTFVTRKLKEFKSKKEVEKAAEGYSKKTIRNMSRNQSIEEIIKPEDILANGKRYENPSFLQPHLLRRWPNWLVDLTEGDQHFAFYLTEEYNCLLNEKKMPSVEALEKAILEAKDLAQLSWQVLLTTAGPYSFVQEAVDEDVAQDIEEDVVDNYASTITSRLLENFTSVDERRNFFVRTAASFCNPISYAEVFQDEFAVIHKYSQKVHSIGRDRRKKLLTPEIKKTLQCTD